SPSGWVAVAKILFLLFPLMLWVAAIWCTQLAIYTVPFRSRRISFFVSILLAWWDGARAVWLYWVGLFRVVVVVLGWLVALGRMALKLIVETTRHLVSLPFAMTSKMTKSYFQPGVPWIAFVMLLFWAVLEATIFTYILYPTVSEVLADLVGAEVPPVAGPLLYLFLLMLILGSFACLQAFLDAMKKKELKFIVQMVLVELFVMFFEVMFLYRELVDAITPWIAQQTGERFRMGIFFTLSLATFGWVGIRGMTWFLFGQYGTPPLLAFISRRPLVTAEAGEALPAPSETQIGWRLPIEEFKREIGWLHEKGDQLLEYLTLPFLHVLAAALNFALILVASRPAFSLPFKNLKEVMETREILSAMHLQPKKVGS
ncbi:MAG TPA: hypothetical protein VFG95_01310, partial [Nitrospiria bacterium]|nr:hypothetical protein [Nitrospiria bacterium]